MIEHIVLIKFKPEITAEQKQELYDGLLKLREDIPGILGGRNGPNSTIESLDQGYSDGFILEFADEQTRQQYLDNEKHKVLGDRIVAATQGGLDGIVVFDLVS